MSLGISVKAAGYYAIPHIEGKRGKIRKIGAQAARSGPQDALEIC
jgi:hypothetical protein